MAVSNIAAPKKCSIPKRMGKSGVKIRVAIVTTEAAPKIFNPFIIGLRERLNDIPEITIKAKAKKVCKTLKVMVFQNAIFIP
jgi:hypothetical protein